MNMQRLRCSVWLWGLWLNTGHFTDSFSLIADRYSRKPLVVFGLLLFALGGAIAAMSDTIYGVIIGRAIAGGGAVSAAVVMALLADVTREENRTEEPWQPWA